MRDLTLVMAYYENAGMLKEHQRIWRHYPEEWRRHLHVIVVDDCSPLSPAIDAVESDDIGLGSFRLYRIDEKRKWNWLACRNLGMAECQTDWALMTDIDHGLPGETLHAILTMELNETHAHRFGRVSMPDLLPYKSHPDSYLLTVKLFDQVGGYDERFSGNYGSSGEFRDRLTIGDGPYQRHADALEELNWLVLVRYPREVIPDASTTQFQRKRQDEGKAIGRIRKERNALPIWETKRLTFPWTRLL